MASEKYVILYLVLHSEWYVNETFNPITMAIVPGVDWIRQLYTVIFVGGTPANPIF